MLVPIEDLIIKEKRKHERRKRAGTTRSVSKPVEETASSPARPSGTVFVVCLPTIVAAPGEKINGGGDFDRDGGGDFHIKADIDYYHIGQVVARYTYNKTERCTHWEPYSAG